VTFEESIASARTRERGETTAMDETTLNYVVSDADGGHVPRQIQDAELFLSSHVTELTELLSRPGVDGGVLDFGWDIPRDAIGQWNRFPSSLLMLCARANLEIEVGVYLRKPIQANDPGDGN
jgi:hypothetical protein